MKRTARLALRNVDLLLSALARVLPGQGRLLELGSGTGEHALAVARAFPALEVQPSDPDPVARASIQAWGREARLANLRPPLDLDLLAPAWRRQRADALLCVNVLHLAPAAALDLLLAGAAEVLPAGGTLLLYGPFRSDGEAPPRLSRFDAELRDHDPSLGIRTLEAVRAAASASDLELAAPEVGVESGDLLLLLRRA